MDKTDNDTLDDADRREALRKLAHYGGVGGTAVILSSAMAAKGASAYSENACNKGNASFCGTP